MSHVRNAWYVAAWAEDVIANRPCAVRLLNEPIFLWRNEAGAVVAFEDRCIHRLAPLSLGRCEGERLRCKYHGLLYDRSGRVVEIPGQPKVPRDLRLRSYAVIQKHGCVWIWMGDEVTADERLLPPVVGLDDPDYVLGRGLFDVDVDAHLINDNLLDLSHLPYLHAATAPVSETWVREPPKFLKCERSVQTEWWVRGQQLKTGQVGDMYRRSDFHVPGILIVTDRIYPPGTADAMQGQEPDLGAPPLNLLIHLVTPMTDRSTRYFYYVGSHRSYADYALRVRDELLALAAKAFVEDKQMIEGQQQIMDLTPNPRIMPTRNDRGVMLFHQLIQKLSRDERSQENR